MKNFLPCWDLNHRPPEYQANALPIELSRLGYMLSMLTELLNVLLLGTFDFIALKTLYCLDTAKNMSAVVLGRIFDLEKVYQFIFG